MPKKIGELLSELEKMGFVNRGGKGSHRNYEHPDGHRLSKKCKSLHTQCLLSSGSIWIA